MTYNSDIHHRRSIRLRDYDYTANGLYFVTLRIFESECVLGKIVDEAMHLNDTGLIVGECWQGIPEHFPHVDLDVLAIMPNHFHGIMMIMDGGGGGHAGTEYEGTGHEGTACRAPTTAMATTESFGKPVSGSLATIIRSFKSATTKRINQFLNHPGCPVWQRNYYERVIRNERELATVREYIVNNPMKWALDKDNPTNMTALSQ
jgi:putative transposase